MRMTKEKVVASSISAKDYERFTEIVRKRGSGITEEILVGLAVLLADKEIEISKKPKTEDDKRILTARVSGHLYDRVKKYTAEKNCRVSDLVYVIVQRVLEEEK